MNNKGMSKEIYNYILENSHALEEINLDKGVVTTTKGSNGAVCTSTGYLRIKLNGRTMQVHQILAVHYFGEVCVGLQVNHIDGDKINNKKDNLEVVTQRENIKHQWESGLSEGTREVMRKLSEDEVEDILKNHVKNKKKGVNTTSYFAKKYNVHRQTIYRIVKNRGYSS